MNQMYIALGALMTSAVFVVTVGSVHARFAIRKMLIEASLETGDALAMPLMGSVMLFSMYVLLRFIPTEAFNAMITVYMCIIGLFALAKVLKAYVRPNIFTGTVCIALVSYYFVTKDWVANNILATCLGVTAIESLTLENFASSTVMLVGLFFYDIFWVFGSDVMLTVATGIDGPIKLLFPQTLFGDHGNKSLLGLGDMIVPGFFIAQTLVFSRDYVKRGNLYFVVAMVAYFLSLLNTMVVMVVFKHGQPALLFIVPWLLITFFATLAIKGDVTAAWQFNTMKCAASMKKGKPNKAAAAMSDTTDSLLAYMMLGVQQLFGFRLDEEELTPRRLKQSPKGANTPKKKH